MAAEPYVSAEDARASSPILAAAFPTEDEPLEERLLYASVIVGELTCRSLVEDQPGAAIPAYLEPIAKTAVVLKAEQAYVRGGTVRARRRSIGSGNLASFSAGPYSESYFGPDVAAKAKMLDADATTHEALWTLADADCRAAWIELWTGETAGASATVSFEYGNRPGAYGAPAPSGPEYL